MSRRGIALRVLLAALFALLLGGAFYWLTEPAERIVEHGFRGEARVNRLLLLERLFEARGLPTTAQRGFAQLPPIDHVLLIGAPRRSLGALGAQRLLDWAAAGGHLVVLPVGAKGEDPILEELELLRLGLPEPKDGTPGRGRGDEKRRLPPEPTGARPDSGSEAPGTEGEDDGTEQADGVGGARKPPGRPVLLRHVGRREVLRSLGPPEGARLITLREGAGRVTVLAEAGPFTNEELGRKDNALLAWRAVVPRDLERPAGLRVIHRDRRPSPWSLLASQAVELAAALGLLLAVFLWGASRRFGPLEPPLAPERRQLAEHVQASGEFLWHQRAERVLLDATRDALRRRLGRGQDGGSALERLAARAAGERRLPAERLQDAMRLVSTRDRQRYTRVVRDLELLRRSR